MKGFLISAQYAMDDIPLRLHADRATAEKGILWFQRLHPDRLHELANESMTVMGRSASMQIEEAELALTEFDEHGRVVGHEVFGLDTQPSVLTGPPKEVS